MKIEELFNLLDELVSADGPWVEKRDAIKAQATEAQKVNLEEFLGWFD